MKHHVTLPLLALACALGCQEVSRSDGRSASDEERPIALADVPQAVLDAARAAVPGIVLEEAVLEVEDGAPVYCLEGEAGGKDYEIDVGADGRVLEVETEDSEDEEGEADDESGDEDEEEDDD